MEEYIGLDVSMKETEYVFGVESAPRTLRLLPNLFAGGHPPRNA